MLVVWQRERLVSLEEPMLAEEQWEQVGEQKYKGGSKSLWEWN